MPEMYDPSGRDWPHDPDGEKGSENGREYGMAILSKKMVGEDDFPLDTETFLAEYGDWPVRINYQRVVPVEDIFDHVTEESFETKVEFHRAVGRAMRSAGLWDFRPEA